MGARAPLAGGNRDRRAPPAGRLMGGPVKSIQRQSPALQSGADRVEKQGESEIGESAGLSTPTGQAATLSNQAAAYARCRHCRGRDAARASHIDAKPAPSRRSGRAAAPHAPRTGSFDSHGVVCPRDLPFWPLWRATHMGGVSASVHARGYVPNDF